MGGILRRSDREQRGGGSHFSTEKMLFIYLINTPLLPILFNGLKDCNQDKFRVEGTSTNIFGQMENKI